MLNILPRSLQSSEYSDEMVETDYIVIRGTRIDLNSVVNSAFLEPEKIAEFRSQFASAEPFSHLIIDNLFNQTLLELVNEEFESLDKKTWRLIEGTYERTHRLPPAPLSFGTATQLYFNVINSGWFINFLSAVTGLKNLIPDPMCHNGGMHEVPSGGFFDIHLDFNLHHETLLHNEMILITYLNKNWRTEYGGSLELWDSSTQACAVEVVPEFGRTVLFRHELQSFHGHPKPVQAPNTRARRSVANYYYTNRNGKKFRYQQHWTLFFPNAEASRWHEALYYLKFQLIPTSLARRLLNRFRSFKQRFH